MIYIYVLQQNGQRLVECLWVSETGESLGLKLMDGFCLVRKDAFLFCKCRSVEKLKIIVARFETLFGRKTFLLYQ